MLRRIAPFMAVAALAVIVPVVLAATPARVLPTQRVDARVLLVSADGTEPGFRAWKAQLQREGVPYSMFVAYSGQSRVLTLTDDDLADYGANHAHYSAVILASGDLGHNVANADGTTSYLSALSDTEWASLAKFERTFGIRQLSDYTARSPSHGLNVAAGATQDGNVGTLTALGKAAFPYLEGPVPIANEDGAIAEAFGYAATPVNGQDWQTLLAGPNGTVYLGIYTHPDDGREEMVMTVASNENQSQAPGDAARQHARVVDGDHEPRVPGARPRAHHDGQPRRCAHAALAREVPAPSSRSARRPLAPASQTTCPAPWETCMRSASTRWLAAAARGAHAATTTAATAATPDLPRGLRCRPIE
jgi:hypothetical protein